MRVLNADMLVCVDCAMVIANADYSGLDYHYDDPDARMEEINRGLSDAGGIIVSGDPENDREYSSYSCDCCRSSLAGYRHHCVLLEQ